MRKTALLAALALLAAPALAQDIPNHSMPIGGGPGAVGFRSVGPCGANQGAVWLSSTSDPTCAGVSGRNLATNNNTIFYISLTGSDASADCTNISTPCATFVGARFQAMTRWDFAGYAVTFEFKDIGTYTGNSGIKWDGCLVGQCDANKIIITGATTNPAQTVIKPSTGTCTNACQAVIAINSGGLSNSQDSGSVGGFTLRFVTIDGSTSGMDTFTCGDSRVVLQNIIFGDQFSSVSNDFQPTVFCGIIVSGNYTINHTQVVHDGNFNNTSTTLTLSNTTGINVGDCVTEATNGSAPVGAAIYTRILPFTRVTAVNPGVSVTVDTATVASDGGTARHLNFAHPGNSHFQMDQKVNLFYVQGAPGPIITVNGIPCYNFFAMSDQASLVSFQTVTFVSDAGGGLAAQVNAAPFYLYGPGATIITDSTNLTGTTSVVPGVVLNLSTILTNASNVAQLAASDWNRLNAYFTKYNLFNMVVSSATGLQNGTVIPSVANLSSPNFTMSRPATQTATSNMSFGGFTCIQGCYWIGSTIQQLALGSITTQNIPLPVNAGGTGVQTFNNNSVLIGQATNPVGSLVGGGGTVLQGVASATPSFTVTPTLGIAGTSTGSLSFAGATSGTVTTQPQSTAGTWNFNYPNSAGASGQLLTSGGGGSTGMTWTGNAIAWTPVLNFGGLTTGITYTTQTGKYTQFGGVVVASGTIVLSSKGTATGTATITNFPVAPTGQVGSCVIGSYALASITTVPMGFIGAGSTLFNLEQAGATGPSVLSDTNFTNTSNLFFTCTYLQ